MDKVQNATIYPRDAHNISRQNISENALKVLYRLNKAGFSAYLVGGSVRDMLLKQHPKDFDVATDAKPEDVRKLFKNCRLIGRRFRLAHVYFGREIIEVATFRAHHGEASKEHGHSHEGLIVRDNVYGTVEDDAERRDFTVNALYYSAADFSVVDFSTGMQDLKSGILRMLGDPEQRYQEDPVRMLRAVRFAAKAGLSIHPATAAPITELAEHLDRIPPARLFEEALKLFLCGNAVEVFRLLEHFDLFSHLFPSTTRCLHAGNAKIVREFLQQTFLNTDTRIADDKPVTPAFLFAALLWYPMLDRVRELQQQGMKRHPAYELACEEILHEQNQRLIIPKRFSLPMKEIWRLQNHLPYRNGKKAFRLLERGRFRAAYDFLLLRAQAGEKVHRLAQWWTDFQACNREDRQAMVEALPRRNPKPIRKRKPSGKPKAK